MQAYCYSILLKRGQKFCNCLGSGLYESREHLKKEMLAEGIKTELLAGYTILNFAIEPIADNILALMTNNKIQPATLADGGMEAD